MWQIDVVRIYPWRCARSTVSVDWPSPCHQVFLPCHLNMPKIRPGVDFGTGLDRKKWAAVHLSKPRSMRPTKKQSRSPSPCKSTESGGQRSHMPKLYQPAPGKIKPIMLYMRQNAKEDSSKRFEDEWNSAHVRIRQRLQRSKIKPIMLYMRQNAKKNSWENSKMRKFEDDWNSVRVKLGARPNQVMSMTNGTRRWITKSARKAHLLKIYFAAQPTFGCRPLCNYARTPRQKYSGSRHFSLLTWTIANRRVRSILNPTMNIHRLNFP
jgi:hypothetical protein